MLLRRPHADILDDASGHVSRQLAGFGELAHDAKRLDTLLMRKAGEELFERMHLCMAVRAVRGDLFQRDSVDGSPLGFGFHGVAVLSALPLATA